MFFLDQERILKWPNLTDLTQQLSQRDCFIVLVDFNTRNDRNDKVAHTQNFERCQCDLEKYQVFL